MFGASISGYGVWGSSVANIAVVGTSTAGLGAGVSGYAPYVGVQGTATGSNPNRQALRGDNAGAAAGYAGYFYGNVQVVGTLSKSAGSFKIDHPLDPANRYLSHSFVESLDLKNIYDGVVTTDALGDAAVMLSAWFEALNLDFRYQLTPLGQFAQAIVSEEIQNNRFAIKSDKPYVKVSWQVTGSRQDPYAKSNRIVVEEDKLVSERGSYVFPEGYGLPRARSIAAVQGAPAALKAPALPRVQNPTTGADLFR